MLPSEEPSLPRRANEKSGSIAAIDRNPTNIPSVALTSRQMPSRRKNSIRNATIRFTVFSHLVHKSFTIES